MHVGIEMNDGSLIRTLQMRSRLNFIHFILILPFLNIYSIHFWLFVFPLFKIVPYLKRISNYDHLIDIFLTVLQFLEIANNESFFDHFLQLQDYNCVTECYMHILA